MGINRGLAVIMVAITGTTAIAVAGLVAIGQTVRGLLAAVFLVALVASCITDRLAAEREVTLLALGEMVVIAAGVAGPAYAVLLQALVLSLVARESGMLASRRQVMSFVLFAVVASAGAGILLTEAHVLIPLLAVIAVGIVAYLALWVAGYLQEFMLEVVHEQT